MWLHLFFVCANSYIALNWCDRFGFAYWINLLAAALNASALLRMLLIPTHYGVDHLLY